MNIMIINPHPVKTVECVTNHIDNGKHAAAESEPNDTRLLSHAARIKTVNVMMHAMGDRTKTIPAAVATPFPPVLNFVKKG